MFDKLREKLGLATTLPAIPEKHKTDTKDRVIKEIAAGISYDMQEYQSWYSTAYWNPNPVMRSPKFTGYHVFQEMDADAHVYNCMSLCKESLLSRELKVRSAIPGDVTEDLKAALVSWNFDRVKQLEQKRRETLSHLDYGFSVSEMILGYEDVKIPDKTVEEDGITKIIKGATLKNALVVQDIHTKSPSAFRFDKQGNLEMFIKPSTDDLFSYPYNSKWRQLNSEELQHFLVLTHDPRFGSRYGWPLKASFFWDYLMKKAGKIYRMIFIEKYGMPMTVGTYDPNKMDESGTGSIQQFQTILAGAQKNSWILKPEGLAIDFVDAVNKSSTMDVYQNLMDFCDGNIAEVCLGHRQAVTTGTTGSYGAAEVKEGPLRQDKLELIASEHDSLFNDQLIRRLIDWNFTPNGFYPYVYSDVEPETDLTKWVFRAVAALNGGIEQSKTQWREKLGLRKPENKADTMSRDLVGVSPTNSGDSDRSGEAGGENVGNLKKAEGLSPEGLSVGRKPRISMSIDL